MDSRPCVWNFQELELQGIHGQLSVRLLTVLMVVDIAISKQSIVLVLVHKRHLSRSMEVSGTELAGDVII
jgi:hypothetical protein